MGLPSLTTAALTFFVPKSIPITRDIKHPIPLLILFTSQAEDTRLAAIITHATLSEY
jgi:hypothetical protein